jgi:hypothetical protein
MIDVILTSCGRYDLLERTLESFYQYNDFPVREFHVYDDGCKDAKEVERLAAKYPDIFFHMGDRRIGQIAAIDYLVQHVTTPFYFTCEDDWEFYRSGFIQDSISVMQEQGDIIQCWLREQSDTNGHPVIKYNDRYSLMSTKYEWKGFSFNPAVRRLTDYEPYATIATFDPRDPSSAERKIGEYYHNKGFRAAILPKGYVKHIGEGRGVR